MKIRLVTSLLFILLITKHDSVRAQKQATDTLTNKSVIALKKAGLDKKIIISKIKTSVTSFDFSTDGLIELKQGGVDDEVIEFMFTTKTTASPAATENRTQSDTTKNADSANVVIIYNEKKCSPVGMSAQVYDANDANMLGMRINKAMFVNFIFQFRINNTTTMKVIMRKLRFPDDKLATDKLFLSKVAGYDASDNFAKDVVDDAGWTNYFYVTYTKNDNMEGAPIFPKKVGFRRSYVKITSINKMERTFNGEVNIDAETNDGTPLKITGSFSNISYDGGNITNPLYQR